jgi:hypothetical protein
LKIKIPSWSSEKVYSSHTMEHFSSFQQTQALPKPGEFIAGVEVCQLEPTLSYICQLFEYLTIFANH